ncbi:divalent-cation tolerance protein CutA [Pannus brasiliensis CCIBt3594]|uniref:Divalent-cation tolerance protein CutA n=1 Tax=Pannus brasiliensis CCIBt3594 TaxID=1427578 RepID=A0AAW9QPS6_9CHRO
MKYIAVVTTVGNLDEARSIARALVERKLVACAHVSEIESFYIWQDALQEEKEFQLVCKTTGDRYQAVESAIRELHPYDLPDIHARALESIYPPYADWLENSVTG